MDIEQSVLDYAAIRPQYEEFTGSLELLLRNLLQSSGIEFFAIEKRTKETISFSEKIEREDKAGKYNSIDDVTDLSGIRVIAYLEEDCNRISTLISNSFKIDEANSVKKEDELDPDKFGYLSTHFIVSISSQRDDLLEYARFKGMKAEVQVRTLLQHTWASIDWKFRYKEERQAPKDLRRRLFRISALLEAADNEFSAVRIALDELQIRYTDQIVSRHLDIAIDTVSLSTYFEASDAVKLLLLEASASGLKVFSAGENTGALSRLSSTAKALGIKSIRDLDGKLISFQKHNKMMFDFLVSNVTPVTKDGTLRLVPAAIVRYSLIAGAAKKDATRALRQFPVVKGYKEVIERFIDTVRDAAG